MSEEKVEVGGDIGRGKKEADAMVALVDHSEDVEILKDIKIPDKFFQRLNTGNPTMDEVFGGPEFPGIMPSATILFTGMPGAGKSTASLQIADALQMESGRNVLYNAGEENRYMVAMVSRRLGISGNFGISSFEDVDRLIKYCKETGVEVLFTDSIQTLSIDSEPDLSDKALLKAVVKRLHKFAKDTDTVIFLIGHITKGGDFAGPMEIKHDIDMHMHIRLNEDTASRELVATKNRFGPAGIPFEVNMTSKGLNFTAAKPIEVKIGEAPGEVGGSRAGARRDAIAKLIKERLLGDEEKGIKPEKLSGYCFSRFPDPFTKKMGVECSGNFWRTMVETVCQKLRNEGHIIGETNIGGRRHFFVEI